MLRPALAVLGETTEISRAPCVKIHASSLEGKKEISSAKTRQHVQLHVLLHTILGAVNPLHAHLVAVLSGLFRL